MDFDPRDYDSRDDDRFDAGTGSALDDLGDDLRLPDIRDRDREDDARELGRGPVDWRQSKHDGQDWRDDTRRRERERSHDPREVFTRDLNLPRGREREIVRDRDREYLPHAYDHLIPLVDRRHLHHRRNTVDAEGGDETPARHQPVP